MNLGYPIISQICTVCSCIYTVDDKVKKHESLSFHWTQTQMEEEQIVERLLSWIQEQYFAMDLDLQMEEA